MSWFKVDDSIHSHPKALATSLAALGLWSMAGAWSGAHLTGGFVPDYAISSLSRGRSELADELVAAGLWKRVRGGYQFHDWSDYQPDAEGERQKREKRREAGRKGGLASGKSRSKPASKPEANASKGASLIVQPPSPSPSPRTEPPSGGSVAPARASPTELASTAHSAEAHRLVEAFAATQKRRPPVSVLTKLARHVDALLAEHWPAELVECSLTAWGAKGLDPAALPSVANEIANRAPEQKRWSKRTEKAFGYLTPEDRAAVEKSGFGVFGRIEGDSL